MQESLLEMPNTLCYERNIMEDILVWLKKMGKNQHKWQYKNYLPHFMVFLVLKKGQWLRKAGNDSEME